MRKAINTAAENTFLYNSGNGRQANELGLAETDGANLIAGASNGVAYWNLGEESGTRADSWGANTLTDNATVTQNDGVSLKDPVNNNNVRQATDLSGNSNNATQTGNVTKKPTYKEAQINGKSAISYDGIDDFLNVATETGLSFTSSDSFSYFAVIKTSATGARALIMGDYNGNPSISFELNSVPPSGKLRVYMSDATPNVKDYLGSSNVMDGNPHIVGFTYDGSTQTIVIYLNGVPQGLTKQSDGTLSGSLNNTGTLKIGKDNRASPFFFNGLMPENLIYNRVLNAGERARITRYLGRKYGIAVS